MAQHLHRSLVPASAVAVLAATLVACAPHQGEPVSGRALYDDFCVSCHGDSGTGDGETAGQLPVRPADLTRIAQRNGGTFPMAAVLSKIDGYTRGGGSAAVMPEMGPVMQQGGVVMMDTGDGLETPVPVRLAALAEYLKSIQQ